MEFPERLGDTIQISYNNSSPAVAVLKNDNVIITWTQSNEDDNYPGIFARIYNKLNFPVKNTFLIDEQARKIHTATLGLNNGGFAVIWMENSDSLRFSYTDIALKIFDNFGTALTEKIMVFGPAGYCYVITNYKSAILIDGRLVIGWGVWKRNGCGSSLSETRIRLFFPDGNPDEGTIIFSSHAEYIELAPLDQGGFMIWYNDGCHIYDANKNLINSNCTPIEIDDKKTTLAFDDYIITQLPNSQIYNRYSVPIQKSFYTSNGKIAPFSNGNFIVVWSGSSGIFSQIYYTPQIIPLINNFNKSFRYFESIPLSLADFSFHGAPTRLMNATLSLSDYQAGRLTTGSFGNATSNYDLFSATWSVFDAPVFDVNSLLASMEFVPSRNYRADVTMSVSITDHFYTYPNVSMSVPIRINKAPVLTKNFLPIFEDEAVLITSEHLAAFDPDPEDADELLIFDVRNSRAGAFTLADRFTNSFFQSNISARSVRFVHDGSEISPYYEISVTDGFDRSPYDPVSVLFFPVIDAPRFIKNQFSITEGETLRLNSSHILATDDGQSPDGELLFSVFNVTHGRFELVENPGFEITEFSGADISAEEIQFVHDGSVSAPNYNIYVADNSNQSEPMLASISFSRINDVIIVNKTITIIEGESLILTPANISATDPDGEVLFANIVFTVRNVLNGQFEFAENPGLEITEFSGANIQAGQVIFIHDGSESAPSFEIAATDGHNGNTDFYTAIIAFSRINDPSTLTANNFIITEGETLPITPAELFVTDPDTLDRNIIFKIEQIHHGYFAFFESQHVAIRQFSQADIIEGKVVFVHDSSENEPDFQLQIFADEIFVTTHAANVDFIHSNDSPQIINPIANLDVLVGKPFDIDFVATFADAEESSSELTYYLALAAEDPLAVIQNNGSRLIQNWIALNQEYKSITGTVPEIEHEFFQLIAKDSGDAFNTTTFSIQGIAEDQTVANAIRSTLISGFSGLVIFFLKRYIQKQRAQIEKNIKTRNPENFTAISKAKAFLAKYLFNLFDFNYVTDLRDQNGDAFLSLISELVIQICDYCYLHGIEFEDLANSPEKLSTLALTAKIFFIGELNWRMTKAEPWEYWSSFFSCKQPRITLVQVKIKIPTIAQKIVAKLCDQQNQQNQQNQQIQQMQTATLFATSYAQEFRYKNFALTLFNNWPDGFNPQCIDFNSETGHEYLQVINELTTALQEKGLNIFNLTSMEQELEAQKIVAILKTEGLENFCKRFMRFRFKNVLYPDNIRTTIPKIITELTERAPVPLSPMQNYFGITADFC